MTLTAETGSSGGSRSGSSSSDNSSVPLTQSSAFGCAACWQGTVEAAWLEYRDVQASSFYVNPASCTKVSLKVGVGRFNDSGVSAVK